MKALVSRALPRLVRALIRFTPARRIDFAVQRDYRYPDQVNLVFFWNGNREYPIFGIQMTAPAAYALADALAQATYKR